MPSQFDRVLMERRSVRKFKPDEVSRHDLNELATLGVWAPTAGNAQTWRFVIVRDSAQLEAIHAVSPGMLAPPPAVIAVCQDEKRAQEVGGRLGAERCAVIDSAMAAQNIMLAAHARNLATCPVLSFHHKAVGQILNLPESVVPHLLIEVGYAETTPSPPERALEGVIRFDRYE